MPDITWEAAMDIWYNLPIPERWALRAAAVQHLVDSGFEEVGSSDINHIVYGFVRSGTYLDEIKNQLEVEA